MNKNELKSIMALFGDTNVTLAEAIGITPQSFSAKINEKKNKNGKVAEFKKGEIRAIIARYHLTPEQVNTIFFAD